MRVERDAKLIELYNTLHDMLYDCVIARLGGVEALPIGLIIPGDSIEYLEKLQSSHDKPEFEKVQALLAKYVRIINFVTEVYEAGLLGENPEYVYSELARLKQEIISPSVLGFDDADDTDIRKIFFHIEEIFNAVEKELTLAEKLQEFIEAGAQFCSEVAGEVGAKFSAFKVGAEETFEQFSINASAYPTTFIQGVEDLVDEIDDKAEDLAYEVDTRFEQACAGVRELLEKKDEPKDEALADLDRLELEAAKLDPDQPELRIDEEQYAQQEFVWQRMTGFSVELHQAIIDNDLQTCQAKARDIFLLAYLLAINSDDTSELQWNAFSGRYNRGQSGQVSMATIEFLRELHFQVSEIPTSSALQESTHNQVCKVLAGLSGQDAITDPASRTGASHAFKEQIRTAIASTSLILPAAPSQDSGELAIDEWKRATTVKILWIFNMIRGSETRELDRAVATFYRDKASGAGGEQSYIPVTKQFSDWLNNNTFTLRRSKVKAQFTEFLAKHVPLEMIESCDNLKKDYPDIHHAAIEKKQELESQQPSTRLSAG